MLERMTQAEEVGYEDEYFPVVQEEPAAAPHDPSEYILSHSPPTHDPMMEAMDSVLERSERGEMTTITEENQPEAQHDGAVVDLSDPVEGDRGVNVQVQEVATSPPDEFVPPNRYQQELYTPADHYEPEHTTQSRKRYPSPPRRRRRRSHASHNIAEAVFFSYGVSVFYGFQAGEERTIMADCEAAGTWQQPVDEDDWEVEEFHYVYDTEAESPRIYNDMFTFKSRSHLFKLSLAHAIAQSTTLSLSEARMPERLELTSSFPKELSVTGHLQLDRKEALKLTGAMYKLRMDVNLIGGILGKSGEPSAVRREARRCPLHVGGQGGDAARTTSPCVLRLTLRHSRALLVRSVAVSALRGDQPVSRDRPARAGTQRPPGRRRRPARDHPRLCRPARHGPRHVDHYLAHCHCVHYCWCE